MVCRNVFGAERQRRVERPPQRVAAESRHAEDQVDRQVHEPGFPGPSHRFGGLRRRVAAVHQLQTRVVEGLYADREAVDAGPAERLQVCRREVVGVGFEGRLLDGRAVEQLRGTGQQPSDRLRRTERRRAAPEIARADRFAAQIVAARFEFAAHRLRERLHAVQFDALVKVAVGADALAEGNMEVKTGHSYQR